MSGTTMDLWTAELARALDLPAGQAVDVGAILALARDVAHHVARPAAPVSTFLAGLAVGLQGGSPEAFARAMDVATSLAAQWQESSGESADDRA